MGFAEMIIKSRLAAQQSGNAGKVVQTVVDAVKGEVPAVVKGMENFADDIAKVFSRPRPEGFVRQTAQASSNVRHAGDTFAQARTGGLTFAPRTKPREFVPQPSTPTTVNPVLDDAIGYNPVNSADDFWNNRMSQQANEYLDDVYRTIDDTLFPSW